MGVKLVKRGLTLFVLYFECDQKHEDIFRIIEIFYIRVKIEPQRKKNKRITQCKKCKLYNHTLNSDEKHTQCIIEKSQTPKCVNCHGNHTANYRGFEEVKELQKLREDR